MGFNIQATDMRVLTHAVPGVGIVLVDSLTD